jgi:GGDEF domain-containing protein
VVTSLPQGDSEGQLQRLKNTIADSDFIYKNNDLSLTISIGACFVDFSSYKDQLSSGKLLEWADQSLYEAKNKGRNKIVIKHCLHNSTQSTTLD